MSTSNHSSTNPLVGVVISDKISKTNHTTWKAQVLATVRGARLMGHLTSVSKAPEEEITVKTEGKETKTSNPAYEEWYATDQQVLGFLLSSLSREALVPVAAKETVAQVWAELESMFSSQTRARVVNTRVALATTQKGNMSMTEYVSKMQDGCCWKTP